MIANIGAVVVIIDVDLTALLLVMDRKMVMEESDVYGGRYDAGDESWMVMWEL